MMLRRFLANASKPSPMDLIAKVKPIEVSSFVARCVGGVEPALGHPVMFLQLNRKNPGTPETCKYCGLRYVHKEVEDDDDEH